MRRYVAVAVAWFTLATGLLTLGCGAAEDVARGPVDGRGEVSSRPDPSTMHGGSEGLAASSRHAEAGLVRPVFEDDAVVCHLGVLLAQQRLDVRSAVAGVVQSLDVDLGADVHQGQVLARLDATPFEHRVSIARAQLRAAEAALEHRRAERRHRRQGARRSRELGDLVSSQDRDTADLALATAEQGEAMAQAEVERLKVLISQVNDEMAQLTLRAPFDGRVAKIERRRHDRVAMGEPIVTLLAEGGQRVRFAVPPGRELEIGRRLWVQTEGGLHRARLDRFSPLLDEASQMLFAEASLETVVSVGFHGAQVQVLLDADGGPEESAQSVHAAVDGVAVGGGLCEALQVGLDAQWIPVG